MRKDRYSEQKSSRFASGPAKDVYKALAILRTAFFLLLMWLWAFDWLRD